MQFMPCMYVGTQRRRLQQEQFSLEFTQLSSLPVDAVSSTTACQPADLVAGQDCYVIDAGFTPSYVTNGTSDFVVGEIGGYLNQTMASGGLNDSSVDLLGLNFLGFTQVPVDGEVTPEGEDRGGDGGVAGVGQSNSIDTTRDNMLIGAAAITVAAIGALALFVVVVRRRRNDQPYLKHLEDDESLFSIDGPATNNSSDSRGSPDQPADRAIVLQDADYDGAESYEEFGVEALHNSTSGWDHDLRMKQPMFVRAAEAQIQEDLGPKQTNTARTYFSPNTVDL